MKGRLGFVSNSSSSSYVILMSKKDYDGALKKLDMHEDMNIAFGNLVADTMTEFRDVVLFNILNTTDDIESDSFYKAMTGVAPVRERGCKHPLPKGVTSEDKFCPKCGCDLWIKMADHDHDRGDPISHVFDEFLEHVGEKNYQQITTHEG